MACFKALCCIWQPPSPSDDAVIPQVPVPVRVAQPQASTDIHVPSLTEVPVEVSDSPSVNIGGVHAATAVENTPPCSPAGPSPSNVDTPASAPTQDSPSNRTGALAPALTEVQPTVPRSPEESVDTPVPVHTEEVPTVSASARSRFRLDPAKAREHIGRIKRFRILVMGRANAGKTTILQRVCDTTDEPEIFNAEGEKVDATVVQGSLKRGYHNIEDELVFKSNERFVFHDSRGFEAGSEGEFDMMKEFVMERAKTTKLDKRIHAIWFCIPLNDSHRMVTAAEKKFFDECDTGHVPVIVLLTKTDTLALDAFQELIEDGLDEEDAMKKAAKVERRNLNECVVKVKGWLDVLRFPPHDYLSLTEMDKEGAECAPLLTCTANALSEEGLQQLLISSQQSNLELCLEFAITKTLMRCMNTLVGKIKPASLSYILSCWFPYRHKLRRRREELGLLFFGEGFGEGLGLEELELLFEDLLDDDLGKEDEIDLDLVPTIITSSSSSVKMPTLAISPQSSMQFIAEHGIGAVLVFEYLYFLLQANNLNSDIQTGLKLAVSMYQTSGVQATVAKLVTAAFWQHGEDVKSLSPILVGIAKENQMSKLQ